MRLAQSLTVPSVAGGQVLSFSLSLAHLKKCSLLLATDDDFLPLIVAIQLNRCRVKGVGPSASIERKG